MMLVFCFSLSIVAVLCSGQRLRLNVYSPGDIIVGGLFPLHTDRSENTDLCFHFSLKSFLRTQVMIYAIREINQRTPRVLPNVTIGYDIYDTFGDVSTAIRATLQLLKNQSDPQSCLVPSHFQSALPEPQTKAVIGEGYSEVSIAVARVIALSSVAQISYGSTSQLLSRKLKFPTFLRTISSDAYQTKAISKLVKMFNWKSVAIVGSEDEYGKYGSDNLVGIFNEMEDICVEFVCTLLDDFSKNMSMLEELVQTINQSSAEAIIMFTKGSNVEVIIKEAIKYSFNRTWIASDSWATNQKIYLLPGIEKAGEVFGFTSKRNEVPGFKEYVMSMFNGTTNSFLEHYLTCYPLCNQSEDNGVKECSTAECPQLPKPCLHLSCLATYIDQDKSYNIYLAVQVIAEALRHLLKCDNHKCERSSAFTASELLVEIKKVNFTVNSTHMFFDDNGDPSIGYDVVYWNTTGSKQRKATSIQSIGEYCPDRKIHVSPDFVRRMHNVTVTAYNCSKTCKPGRELKKQNKTCCNDCVPCAEGEFSPGNGTRCSKCKTEQYSSPQRDTCLEKTVEFLQRSDPVIIFLTCLEVFGIIVIIVFAVLFAIHRGTPVVKAVGGYWCFLELFCLLVCFCITFNFAGRPTVASCMLGLPVFGVAFSLCISCILTNLLQILVGFNFDPRNQCWMKKLNKPVAVVMMVSGIQLALCVAWLFFSPPRPVQRPRNKTMLKTCVSGSHAFLIAMLAYNCFLALICFLFAFKGRRLPDLYKNASLISISMLLYLVSWVFTIPIYINLDWKYKRAIGSAAIVISCYSILCCHLAPKCYIMVFRKEINNENAITMHIRKHFEQNNMAVVKS